MCGIVGLSTGALSEGDARAHVERMATRIHHRGPDGGGVASHLEATIGMKRLAIVDLARGNQPMFSDDRSIALVYNGEIYNAPALRADLTKQGVRFDTHSDTEVLLRLYERDPEHVEEHLAGMWAFAIHDRKRRKLVLSRDRFGIKPLFLAVRNGTIAFASELRAFERTFAPLADAFTVDRSAAHAMLAWGYVPANETIFRGVERVPPAHRVTFDLATRERTTRGYWEVRPSPATVGLQSLDEACSLVEEVLTRSVKEHLESDVPIASFLSGGIDSSLVTAYAAEQGSVTAYTVGFRERRFDESIFARATAERLRIPIHIALFDEAVAREHLGEALAAYDEPFGDSSSLATYLLSKQVATKYKVALAGDGGDEVFAGYRKYHIVPIRRMLGRVPFARSVVGEALGLLPRRIDRTGKVSDFLRVAGKVGRGLTSNDACAYVALTQLGTLAETASLVEGTTDAERFVRVALERFERTLGTPLQRSMASDLWNPLPNDMLTKVDRASMACSLEVRVPFLDHRVVEVGVGLPERFVLDRNGKRVLRAIHEHRFGRALARRPKQGFGVPVESWLRTSLAPACHELFGRSRLSRFGILSPDALSDGAHRRLLERSPILVWHAFSLAAWCEATLGDGPEAMRQIVR